MAWCVFVSSLIGKHRMVNVLSFVLFSLYGNFQSCFFPAHTNFDEENDAETEIILPKKKQRRETKKQPDSCKAYKDYINAIIA